jgi:hypothetical protein
MSFIQRYASSESSSRVPDFICVPAGVVSAPLWNSDQSRFAGMFTVSDIIHLIQYYYKSSTYEGAAADVENLRLESLRGIPFHVCHPRLF